jgi:hypothetical protein
MDTPSMLWFLSQPLPPLNSLPARHRLAAFLLPGFPFTGGLAGVASHTPFDRAVLTFSDLGDAFAADNVTFATDKASEEGQALILLSAGVSVLLFLHAPSQGNPILLSLMAGR